MSEKRVSLTDRWQGLVDNLDRLTDPEKRSDLFKGSQWDMLMELHTFTSRVINPTDLVLTTIERVRDTVIENPEDYKDEEKFRKVLTDIESDDPINFRPRKKSDIA